MVDTPDECAQLCISAVILSGLGIRCLSFDYYVSRAHARPKRAAD